MAAGHSQTDMLSRTRREQKKRGKPAAFSGLQIVLAATGITVALLLFAFGAIGMLMMARTPQEPFAGKLDTQPPLVQQVETPQAPAETEMPTSVHTKMPEPAPEKTENADQDKRTVKTLRVIAPPVSEPEPTETVKQEQSPVAEPETTAAIPPSKTELQQKQQPRAARQQQVRRQYPVRRQASEPQSDNPLLRLFGVKQYR